LLVRPRVPAKAFASIALVVIGMVLAPAVATASSGVGRVPVAFRLPYLAGQRYAVTQSWHDPYSHHGKSAYAYDFALPMRTPVVAAAAGVVAFAESGHRGCGDESLRSAANFVTIYHADGTATLYAHLSRVTAHVGDVVTSGQVIGYSGKTGYTDCQPHLHFARQKQGRAVTQSIPVYFVEAGHHRLRKGAAVTSRNPVCSQATTGLPDDAFCGLYTTATDLGALQVTRLDRRIRVGTPTSSTTRAAARTSPGPISASWLGRYTFGASGTYLFDVETDGAVQVWIDGAVLLDTALDPAASIEAPAAPGAAAAPPLDAPGAIQAPTVTDGPAPGERVLTVWLPAGQHVIRLDYAAGAGPFLRFDWGQVDADAVVRTLY
jgi:peptidase M23-like protein/PA14 domain-containing protein